MKKILFVSSECVPFIKTGGLADVAGELPKYIDKEKYDVRVILPNYRAIPEKFKQNFVYKTHFYMDLSWRRQYVGILETVVNGVTFYLVDNEYYFNGDRPYGNIYEDMEKFAFFCRAVLSALPSLDFRPDIIHCNDWQTGLIPVYLKDFDSFARDSFYQGIKSIMTIHNLKFQGVWDKKTVKDMTGLSDYYFVPDKLEAYGDANYLKGGIVYADYVTTVSDTYAGEIQMPFYGEGLDGLMRARNNCLCGIVNGIDYSEYNPETDKYIWYPFNAGNFRKEKAKNKKELQKELGLEVDEKKFMVGLVSRLTDQKGLDLVNAIFEQLIDGNTQFVLIGTGEQQYEDSFRYFESEHKGTVCSNIMYSDERAHKLYAASDSMLVPSRFEPCGLTQLIAFRYGSLPIVRETGGLKDTVQPYNEFDQTGNGFSFSGYDAGQLLNTINYAKTVYFTDRKSWNAMVQRAMKSDHSWNASAKEYVDLYNSLLH